MLYCTVCKQFIDTQDITVSNGKIVDVCHKCVIDLQESIAAEAAIEDRELGDMMDEMKDWERMRMNWRKKS